MNFDNLLFRINFEITAVVADEDFASQIERVLENDSANSGLMAAGEYDEKPRWVRFGVQLARLTAPLQCIVMQQGSGAGMKTGSARL